jgi:ribosomal protein S12 methylthiotransferase
VPEEVKESRWHRFMAVQREVSRKQLARKVGKRLPVIIDQAGGPIAKGRSKYEAPEIDGTVHVASRRPLRVGDTVTVRIERSDDYDLFGTAV